MKKIILSLFFVFILISSSFAQIKKGSLFLGGDIGGTTQKTKTGDVATNKQQNITISPVFGKAVKENLVFGVNAGFGIFSNDNPSTSADEYRRVLYSAGVFLRKYKNIAKSGFYLFVQGGAGASHYKEEFESNSTVFDKTRRLVVNINAYPGVSYAINNKLHLETGFANLLSLHYLHEKRESGNPVTVYKTNGFGLSSSLNNASSFYLGFRLLISK